jgi:hypothetical protein
MMINDLPIKVTGHVHAEYEDNGEVLLDQFNDIHPQNMARVIARALAHEENSWVFQMKLGNGGTHIDANLQIEYLQPITQGVSATLYNTTYEEIIDDQNASNPIDNSVVSYASPDPAITSLVVCKMKLDSTEPAGQAPNDGSTTNPDSTFTFDELGLFTSDDPALMLSHLIFSPIEKTSNRSILVTYTLTVSVS